jgi:cupin 2 domain-containing protein
MGSEMAEHDLIRFLDKVGQLQALVKSLDADPERRDQLAACSSHNQVVGYCQRLGF